jgi:hypothetical protein
MKFKMAAKAGHSLTLDPKEKMFQNVSSLKSLGQLKPNCPGMIIVRSSTNFLFYADRKFKMTTTAGHRLTFDAMGKCSMPSSQKLQIFSLGSNVKLCPALAAILNFISKQKT